MKKARASSLPTGRSIAVAACLVAVAAFSAALAEPARTPEASRDLAKALAGRVAGEPVGCIPNYRATRMQIIDDRTILFRSNRTIYLQTPPAGCFGIGNQLNTLVHRGRSDNEYCEGDINRLVQLNTGMDRGSCAFGPFVPYTKPN
jgi:hypothetical protein